MHSPEELWKSIESDKERDWYSASVEYWDRQEASFNGVLGGYGHVSEPDVAESRKFLLKAMAGPIREVAARQRKLTAIGMPVLNSEFFQNTFRHSQRDLHTACDGHHEACYVSIW